VQMEGLRAKKEEAHASERVIKAKTTLNILISRRITTFFSRGQSLRLASIVDKDVIQKESAYRKSSVCFCLFRNAFLASSSNDLFHAFFSSFFILSSELQRNLSMWMMKIGLFVSFFLYCICSVCLFQSFLSFFLLLLSRKEYQKQSSKVLGKGLTMEQLQSSNPNSLGNDQQLEHAFAAKALKYAETHMKILQLTKDKKKLSLSSIDEVIYLDFKTQFPKLDVSKFDEVQILLSSPFSLPFPLSCSSFLLAFSLSCCWLFICVLTLLICVPLFASFSFFSPSLSLFLSPSGYFEI
jgi:hypothetical protein